MPKTLVSLALTAALALSLPASPVRADERTEQWVGAAIMLGIVGLGIHASRERDRDRAAEAATRDVAPLGDHVWIEQPRHRNALPQECLRRYRTQTGVTRLFDGDCLDQRFSGAAHLPLSCALTVRSGGRFESGFRPRCLRDAGYRLAGH